jgi:hypothetical protein
MKSLKSIPLLRFDNVLYVPESLDKININLNKPKPTPLKYLKNVVDIYLFLFFYKKLNQPSKDNYSSNEQLTLCASQSEGQQDVATITAQYCKSPHPQYTMLLFDHSYHSWGYSSLSWNSSKWYQEGNSIPPIVYLP